MRLCIGFAFCDNAADIFYKGEALCGRCDLRKYGAVIGTLETAAPSVRPKGRVAGEAVSPLSADPAPAPTSDEFYDLLDSKGWDLVDLEAALIEFLETA